MTILNSAKNTSLGWSRTAGTRTIRGKTANIRQFSKVDWNKGPRGLWSGGSAMRSNAVEKIWYSTPLGKASSVAWHGRGCQVTGVLVPGICDQSFEIWLPQLLQIKRAWIGCSIAIRRVVAKLYENWDRKEEKVECWITRWMHSEHLSICGHCIL